MHEAGRLIREWRRNHDPSLSAEEFGRTYGEPKSWRPQTVYNWEKRGKVARPAIQRRLALLGICKPEDWLKPPQKHTANGKPKRRKGPSMEPFFDMHTHGFVRIATATPRTRTADVDYNVLGILEQAGAAHAQKVDLLLYPELCLSSYAIDDLHMQAALLDSVEDAVETIRAASEKLTPVLVIGAPLRRNGGVYNCALAISRGVILGAVPKSFLPNYREYYEKRYFARGNNCRGLELTLNGATVPFGIDLIFAATNLPGFTFGIEICEDFWSPSQPSTMAALAGANILLNLSASNITIGKSDERHMLCRASSSRNVCAYAYSASGFGESTTDLSWDGQGMVYELGDLMIESARFELEPALCVTDIDTQRIRNERMRMGTFNDAAEDAGRPEDTYRTIDFAHRYTPGDIGLKRAIRRFPFVPNRREKLDDDCYEAFNIQVDALMRRMQATQTNSLIIGVSGGLDSTHALIVAAKACDTLGLPRTTIRAYTMPGFATSAGTKSNAWKLMDAFNVTAEEIDIRPAATQMLKDMEHPFADGEPVHDVAFENVQAGLRTDYLFRLANHHKGFVIGTGDLSELALGWCTYGVGDQMSHYGVNAGVPKTLIQYLIRWCTRTNQFDAACDAALEQVLATEISPELVPADADGQIQSTESIIGPYELNDFFLHHTIRWGQKPSHIAFLCWHAWRNRETGLWPHGFPNDSKNEYDLAIIRSWLEKFVKRFFAFSQFKRSALPNGPKVSSGGALSPRGDWRAPSDAAAEVWLNELLTNVPEKN